MSPSLQDLAARLRADGGLMAEAVRDPAPGSGTHLGDTAAAGPRTAERAADYALLVEAIREGHLAHYGEGRVLGTGDGDLALLAGDRLYALGLERLAGLADLESVGILAGVIARCAQAHAEGRPEDAEAAWREGAAAVAERGGAGESALGPNR